MFISCGKFDRKKYSKKDLKKLDFSKNYDFKHKEAVTGNSDYFEWNLECEKLNCNISYLHGVKKYSKKILYLCPINSNFKCNEDKINFRTFVIDNDYFV